MALSLQEANRIVDGAVAKARELNIRISVAVCDAGGRLIVMPHSDPAVVREAKAAGLLCTPGVATPTEGFSALANGADAKWLTDLAAVPRINRAARDWSSAYFQALKGYGIQAASAFSGPSATFDWGRGDRSEGPRAGQGRRGRGGRGP